MGNCLFVSITIKNYQLFKGEFLACHLRFFRGYGTSATLEGLEPSTEYSYRLCVIGPDNEKSEFSSACTVKTTSKNISY